MICTKCKVDKPLTDEFFRRRPETKLGFRRQCTECHKATNNSWKQNNIETHAQINKNWRMANLEHSNRIARIYYYNNKEKVRNRNRRYESERFSIDLGYRLKKSLRRRMWQALKKTKKSASTMKLVGCSLEDLKLHLASKFTEGMTFENYGEWHIDHIKPCAKFDLTDPIQQRECFHFTNLQPLWAVDNLRKSDTWL